MATFARKVSRATWKVSRTAGDINAFQTGGLPRLARRVARRRATRGWYQFFRNLDRG